MFVCLFQLYICTYVFFNKRYIKQKDLGKVRFSRKVGSLGTLKSTVRTSDVPRYYTLCSLQGRAGQGRACRIDVVKRFQLRGSTGLRGWRGLRERGMHKVYVDR